MRKTYKLSIIKNFLYFIPSLLFFISSFAFLKYLIPTFEFVDFFSFPTFFVLIALLPAPIIHISYLVNDLGLRLIIDDNKIIFKKFRSEKAIDNHKIEKLTLVTVPLNNIIPYAMYSYSIIELQSEEKFYISCLTIAPMDLVKSLNLNKFKVIELSSTFPLM
ncbi:MAG: hypothetical protein KDC79_07865 [Cyclobacteriaceae bacterium]|nr:hypothetical protein [Cyclobacteriaceae bacterium]